MMKKNNSPEISLQFLGAAGTVTGSKFLVSFENKKIMVDCGLFQGLKELRLLNWEELPVDPSTVDQVIITHGHLDHVGYLPRLVRQGFKGDVFGTHPSLEIAEVILLDSAKIQEEDAAHANQEGYSKHEIAEPLYNLKDAHMAISLMRGVDINKWHEIDDDIRFRLKYNGHILGAAFVELEISGRRLVFSGDIGRRNDLMLFPPERPAKADCLVMEATYGDRHHPDKPTESKLRDLINETVKNKGTVIIPSFTVDRAQDLIWMLVTMINKKEIPAIPIYLDSPMGTNVSRIFCRYDEWHKLGTDVFDKAFEKVKNVRSVEDTNRVSANKQSKIVIAGSGMLNGGRVLHYLKNYLEKPDALILLTGYQAVGTRGRQLLEGAREVKIHGQYYPVKARVEMIDTLSSHADQDDLLDWLSALNHKPDALFLAHGEKHAADALRVKIKHKFGWYASIPELFETYPV